MRAGEVTHVDISSQQSVVQGKINITGSASLANTSFRFRLRAGGLSSTPTQLGAGFAKLNLTTGDYELILSEGDWDITMSIPFFSRFPDDLVVADELLNFTDGIGLQNLVPTSANNPITHDFNLPMGEVTITFRIAGNTGATMSNPALRGNCSLIDANNQLVHSYSFSANNSRQQNVAVGSVGFFGMEGTCDITASATVNGSHVTFGRVSVDVVPSVTKVVDVAGPTLTMQFPEPNLMTSNPNITVTGMVTDPAGIASVTVNTVDATLTSTNNPSDPNEVSFSATVSLARGPNEIQAVATDTATLPITSSDTRTVFRDSGPPTLTWTPADATTFPTQGLTTPVVVTGKADDDAGINSIKVNGVMVAFQSTSNVTKPNEVSFTATVDAHDGDNFIEVVVKDISMRLITQTHKIVITINDPGALSVTPLTGISASGEFGGPFSGSTSVPYILENTGGEPLDFVFDFVGFRHDSTTGATSDSTWVTVTNGTGTLPAGAMATATVAINTVANSLPTGSYSGTVGITNTTNGNGDTTRPVALQVLVPGTMDALPLTGLVSSGLEGGTFSPGSIDYVLTNLGETDVNFDISGIQSWLSLDFVGAAQSSATGTIGGIIQPGTTKTVRASINATANGLAPALHSDTLTFHHSSPSGRVSGSFTRPVSLQVKKLGELSVTGSDLVSTGEQGGGPYSPGFTSYLLTNVGQSPINYTVSHASAWIAVSNTAGTLAVGGSATVTVTINALAANALSAGEVADMIVFTNTTNGRGTTARPASLTVLVPGTLSVLPTTAIASTGEFGGPFTPFLDTYTLTNTGETPLSYDASTTLAWLTLGGSTTGSLAPGIFTTVSATINVNADTLLPGTFSGSVFFTNTKNHRGDREVPWSLLVVDTTAPIVTAPVNVTAEATGLQTTVAIGTATATDAVDPIPTITSDAPATFPVGVTTVTWTATDATGNAGTATQTVTVTDTTPPTISAHLTPVGEGDEDGDSDEGRFIISFSATDLVDPDPTVSAVLLVPGTAPIAVLNGRLLEFEFDDEKVEVEFEVKGGVSILEIEAPSLNLRVTATDASGNISTFDVQPTGLTADNDDDTDPLAADDD